MSSFLFIYPFFFLAFLFALKFFLQNRKLKNIPPGPPSLPMLGYLHQVSKPLHQAFHRISQRSGQIVSLWFGSFLVVVVSSVSEVQECFTENDIIVANRPRFLSGQYISYKCTTIELAPYGGHWCNFRRITAVEMLSTNCFNKFLEMRRDEKQLVQKLAQGSHKVFAKVEMKSRVLEMIFNAIMRMTSGRRYWEHDHEVKDVEEARNFRQIIKDVLEIGMANNPADFVPILRWFDHDHLVRRLNSLHKKFDGFLQGLIDEHRNAKQQRANTMIDHLLSLQESQPEEIIL